MDRKQVIEVATKWLATKTNVQACPFCGSKNWQLGHVVGMPIFDEKTQGFDMMKLMAHVAVMCGDCAIVYFFSAGKMGLKP